MKDRIKWIDTARGLGLLFVVIGHVVTTPIRRDYSWAMAVYNCMYYFHMPYLLFISGVSFGISYDRYLNKKVGEYLRDKAKRLLIPYVIYSGVIYLCFCAAHLIPKISKILTSSGYARITPLEWVVELVKGNNQYCIHLWYIYFLFLISAVSFLLIKLIGKKFSIVLLSLSIIGYVFLKPTLDWHILQAVSKLSLWFSIGIILMPLVISLEKASFIVRIIIVLISPILLSVKNKGLSFGSTIANQLFNILCIASIIFALVVISQFLGTKKEQFLYWLGKNSFCIYLFHQPLFASGFGMILYGLLGLPIWLCLMVSFISCFVFPILIQKCLRMVHINLL